MTSPEGATGNAQYPMSGIGRVVPVFGRPLSALIAPADGRVERDIPCTMVAYLLQGPDGVGVTA